MDILVVTPELSPYERTSTAADAVAALAKALCQLEHRVTVAAPRRPGFEASGLLVARRLTPLALEGGVELTVLDGQLSTGAKLVLFDAPGTEDPTLLGRAARALAESRAERGEPFDVVHLHGAQSAAFTLGVRTSPAPVVLTIHDASERGVVPASVLAQVSVGEIPAGAREGAGVSLLALAALDADAVTAVSPTVAGDLLDPERGGALAGVLERGTREAIGILSGLDYAVANPATDAALKARFDAEDVSNKGSCKTELLRSLGLELDPGRPLVVAPLSAPGDGAELLKSAVPLLLRNDASLVVLVREPGEIQAAFEALGKEFSGRLGVEVTADESRVRRATAGADFMLLPTPYEPNGVLSRVAQRYGALPIARAAGAHVDTIVDADAELETGTGFLFDEWSAPALAGAVARAISAYAAPRFPMLRRRVMRLDLSFDRAARRYVQVYKQVIQARQKPAR
ncbi:MAG TPA: glycogen/starch synthase [Polyangiaceae bacterium]|nr:glycogen/starch synthase [Polyangiaceae bacterium]